MRDPLHVEDERVLNHEQNAPVVAFLRERAVPRPGGGYEEHAHPDLADFLRDSGEALGVRAEYFFGYQTLVSQNGVIFAYATGTQVLVFRAPEGGFDRDLPPGTPEIEVVPGWVPTDAWLGSRMDWTVREGDAAIEERFIAAAIAAEALPSGTPIETNGNA